MLEIEGRQILTTLAEKVDPAHCAVVVIDMQKDFTTAGCFWDNLGQLDVDRRHLGGQRSLKRLDPGVVDLAEEAHCQVQQFAGDEP